MKHPRARPITACLAVANLYLDHVKRFGDGRACGCERLSPDTSCNVGEALWRVQVKEFLRFDDGRRRP